MQHFDDGASSASRWERPLLAGGVVAGVMFLAAMGLFIGLVAPHMPPLEAPAAERASFYARVAADPVYAATRLLIFAQLAPLTMFFAALYAELRRVEGGSGALALAVFGAGMIGAVLTPVAELVEGHLLLGLAAAGADPVVTVGFDGMTPVSFAISGLPQLVVLAGAGRLLGATRRVARWIAWLGYGIAGLGLLSLGVIMLPALFFLGMLSAILYKVWIIGVSVSLLRRLPAPHPEARLELAA